MSSKYRVGQTVVNRRTGREHKIVDVQLMVEPFKAEYTLVSGKNYKSKKLEGDIDALYSIKAQ